MILIPVLKKDHDWDKHMEKVDEESQELNKAIQEVVSNKDEKSLDHVAEEAFDIIQVAIGILDKVEKESYGIVKKMSGKHYGKLVYRGWRIDKVLRVEED
ncbi:hypothetical protein [Anaerophilus nitritogenes]|uniref:hypothetical protein n=1 Tax=Anaerophilus nitritogenes TaxID=2498136 RepID=UPI00101E18E8|nr:hypothetical protein [Anaerophilus nitritogenes]